MRFPPLPLVLHFRINPVDSHVLVVSVFPDCRARLMKKILRFLAVAAVTAGISHGFANQAQGQNRQSIGDLSPSDSVQPAAMQEGYVGDLHEPAPLPTARVSHTGGWNGPAIRDSKPSCNSHVMRSRGHGSIGQAMHCGNPDAWFSSEALLWFPEARTSPLLATSANQGALPIPGQPGYQAEYGGRTYTGMTPGMRFDGGIYTADGSLGFRGRVWFLFNTSDSFAGAADPTTRSLGVPFFDPSVGIENSLNVGGALVPPRQGTLNIRSELDLVGSELYGRLLLMGGDGFRVEAIGGYSYFLIRDKLMLNASSTILPGGPQFDFSDRFDARNDFHGGQIGFSTQVNKGRFSLTSLTKVHLGNNRQQLTVRGNSSTTILGAPPIVTDTTGGIFAMDNQGRTARSVFTFAPEANVKLGYRMRNYIDFSVGYSFIYWNRVALAGDQMDRIVDSTGLVNNVATVAQPSRLFNDRGFFVHGVDLGMTIQY